MTILGTALLVLTSAGAVVRSDAFEIAHAALSCVLFTFGSVAFLWAYLLGLSRSRTEVVSMPGLFFLAGDAAPVAVRRRFRWALAVEVGAVLIAAFARPYTVVAFGILAPMYAMGLMAVWGGRHARFPARPWRSSPERA